MTERGPESRSSLKADLDAALRAGFGPSPTASEAGRSVLGRLGGDLASRVVLLKEDAGENAPLVRADLPACQPRSEGRYQVMGEIARGGVGVVLRGHDVDLGRDVAMKVLRDEHAKDPWVLQRFVEEAQIGGQLQHPGIVPVYEMGLREDRRPYFTMKLVKGRTLAVLLADRKSPTEGRAGFLAIFASTCQTIAYAHARGVIHRDLKPANVMVGAFGEVLVVDWGMGKVLAQGGVADERKAKRAAEPELSVIATVRSEGTGSNSVVGSVMGTPRYMPPEQARGEVEQVDERADVFALGAILCEILTGKPPYTGTEQEALAQAVRGQVEPAHARLEACGAAPELVALAKDCLSSAPAARPRHAGNLAKEVAAYLASVEERAKAAELSAAEERVKAREERKRRRLSLALSAVIGALVTVGGGIWFLVERAHRARADVAERGIAQALEEATLLRGKASAGADLVAWKDAISAARRAEALAASPDARADTRAKASGLLADLEASEREARAQADETARDDSMVARLEELRVAFTSGDVDGLDERYVTAFAEYGIDLRAEVTEPAAASVRRSSIAPVLRIGLEELRGIRSLAKAPLEELLRVIEAADDDPWRRRLRAARTHVDCQELLRTADFDAMPVEDLILLARAVSAHGDRTAAFALAERVVRRHPDDCAANVMASAIASSLTPPRREEAIRFLAAAVALRPGLPLLRHYLGSQHGIRQEAGDMEVAAAEFEEAVRLAPADHRHLLPLIQTRLNLGEGARAMVACETALRLAPRDARIPFHQGDCFEAVGRFQEALEAYRRGSEMTGRPRSALRSDLATRYDKIERGAQLEPRLASVLEGSESPRDEEERAWFAYLALRRSQYAAAAALYAQAMEEDPMVAEFPMTRMDAAFAAARASAGTTDSPPEESERARLRGQALEWMRLDLAAYMRRARESPRDPSAALSHLVRYRWAPELAPIRDAAAVAGLPREEQAALREHWADVEEALIRLRAAEPGNAR